MGRVTSLRLGNVNFILFSSLFLKETHISNTYLIVCAKKESQKTKQKRKKEEATLWNRKIRALAKKNRSKFVV